MSKKAAKNEVAKPTSKEIWTVLDNAAQETLSASRADETPFDLVGYAHDNARDTFAEQRRSDEEGSEEFYALCLRSLESSLSVANDTLCAWFKQRGVRW